MTYIYGIRTELHFWELKKWLKEHKEDSMPLWLHVDEINQQRLEDYM